MVIIPEILKYQVTESDLVASREWFLDLTRQQQINYVTTATENMLN